MAGWFIRLRGMESGNSWFRDWLLKKTAFIHSFIHSMPQVLQYPQAHPIPQNRFGDFFFPAIAINAIPPTAATPTIIKTIVTQPIRPLDPGLERNMLVGLRGLEAPGAPGVVF